MTTLLSYLLLEGGNALKASPISQAELGRVKETLLHAITRALDIPFEKARLIGSAGNKPNPTDLSGDIDVAVEVDPAKAEAAIKELAGDRPSRPMAGINVYSFGYDVGGKVVQVDLMPVDSIRYAVWSMQAHPIDLKHGLKGAHRNELMFAIARHAGYDVKKKDESGEPIEVERYFYDLGRGLFRGTQSRVGKRKLKKSLSTTDRKLLTNDPSKITKLLFGDSVTKSQVSTFQGALDAIMADGFPHKDQRDAILKQAADGIKKKGLMMPETLGKLV